MKPIFILLLTLLSCTIPVLARRSSVKTLLNRLTQLQKQGVMIGQQDALFYGTTWKWEFGRSDMQDVCGDHPAVLGCELSGIELGHDRNIDGVPFKAMREQIINFASHGGIVTLSWHCHNPANGESAWDVKADAVAKVSPGGEKHLLMQEWTARVIDFIKSLRDAQGRPIPVIFRPWHEMSGNWFWWGAEHCTTSQFKALYRMTYKQFKRAKMNHIIWCYSPGAKVDDTPEHYFSFYPGNEIVDILGFDIYHNATAEEFVKTTQGDLKIMHDYALKHNKLYAITETGYRNTPDANWYSSVLMPSINNFNPIYVLLWRNAWDNPEENYGPAPEKACAPDFRNLHANKQFLFLKDLKHD